jgi:hypothetical protein
VTVAPPKTELVMDAQEKRKKDRMVIIRDLVIFQIKLLLDGFKDIVASPIAIGAAALDILAPTAKRGERFYKVLHAGERFDQWLNLFGASKQATEHEEGLFGASRAGADSLLGKLEQYVRGYEESEEPEQPVSANSAR